MSTPSISVVMSVYNNADTLPAALGSILSQEGVALELIVIDDGSTDASGQILDEVAARDPRLKVVHKQNEGLTRALIEGCGMASAPWIARQDADDLSLPGRLRAQLDRALQPDVPVLVTCGAMWTTPDGIDIFPSIASAEPEELRLRILEEGRSICAHGTALFPKVAYEAVGGYRSEFYYAQDLDLFTRLARFGPVAALSEVLYRYTFSPHSISTHSASVQKKFRELIGRSDAEALKEAEALSGKARQGKLRKATPFAGYYFIGCCLRKKNPAVAAAYFRKALWAKPWSAHALIRLVSVWVGG